MADDRAITGTTFYRAPRVRPLPLVALVLTTGVLIGLGERGDVLLRAAPAALSEETYCSELPRRPCS